MSQRFEIPIEPKGYNLFLIDDYLRTIRSKEERQKLIREVGYSAEKREGYERERGLPRGAVELALLAEDKRVAELNDEMNKRLSDLYAQRASRNEINDTFKEAASRAAGIKALYPEAFQFLAHYSLLSKRNASMFRGDYRFSNEFKIMKVDCSPVCGNDPVNVDVCINVNYFVFLNAAVVANLALGINVVALYGLLLVYILLAWTIVIP